MPPERRSAMPLAAAAVASASMFVVSAQTASAEWTVEEKTISDLFYAYQSGLTTASTVVQQYVTRIQTYDDGPTGVNSVGQINPNLMADAAAVDALIAGGAKVSQYPLLGVPVLVKDSYDVAGMITTNGVSVLNGAGTPGSTTLVAPKDAFSVAQLKAAGAIILGKANMSTMAYSYNGVDNAHGVVKNPYQPQRSPGGSSSGSGASIAANLAMISMGGETGGSIRVPANHNALVGLKTSAGLVDPGGTWPLSPARDVAGPLGKTVTDIAYAMNALSAPSSTNLWNDTPFYPGADPGTVRPANYASFLDANALSGKVIAIPKYMVNQGTRAYEGNVAPTVLSSFNQAVADIKAQGATVVYVDVPAADKYYNTIGRPNSLGGATTTGFGYDYPTTTAGGTTPATAWSNWAAAFYYNELIKSYNDPVVKDLNDFAYALQKGVEGNAGDPRSTLGTKTVNPTTGAITWGGAAGNILNLANILNAGNAKGFGDANGDGLPDNPDAIKALQAFQDLRVAEFEGFMSDPNLVDDPSTPFDESSIDKIDAFAAPTFAGVSPLQRFITGNAMVDPYDPTWTPSGGSAFGSLLGRFESNILGVPAISVPMGYAPDGTPMGMQFFAEFLSEGKLLGLAYDYEQATKWRVAPDLAFAVPEPAGVIIWGLSALVFTARRRRAV